MHVNSQPTSEQCFSSAAETDTNSLWPKHGAGKNQSQCPIEIPIEAEDHVSGRLLAWGPKDVLDQRKGSLQDMAERISISLNYLQRSNSLYQQANFDHLTGLLNRQSFRDKVAEEIMRAERTGNFGALIFFDLDKFKLINDAAGHHRGDKVLQNIASTLKQLLRKSDSAARLGGDEFAICLPECTDAQDIADVCQRIIDAISRPVSLDGYEYLVSASLGVVLFPDDGNTYDTLLRKADVAMYRAKTSGGRRYVFFDDRMEEANRDRILLEGMLRKAVAEGDLSVFFQPKLDVAQDKITSAEALMRWYDDDRGWVSPAEFVPIAESTEIIFSFQEILVDQASSLLKESDAKTLGLQRVAINASSKELQREDYADRLLEQIKQHDLTPNRFEVEVTESLMANNTEQIIEQLNKLRKQGVAISLDDFGTGYSSLNMLRRLPLDTLKLDQSFVSDMLSVDSAKLIVQQITQIAHALNLGVVAEGVEDKATLDILNDFGCDYIQGYFVARPMPNDEFLTILRDNPSCVSQGSRTALAKTA